MFCKLFFFFLPVPINDRDGESNDENAPLPQETERDPMADITLGNILEHFFLF